MIYFLIEPQHKLQNKAFKIDKTVKKFPEQKNLLTTKNENKNDTTFMDKYGLKKMKNNEVSSQKIKSK